MAAYAGGHITWGPAGAPGEQQHFAIAGPDLKLFWDQSPDRGESNSRGFAEPVENFTFVGCVRALDSLRPRIVRSTLTCCRLSRVNQSVKNARCIAWAPAERPAGLLAAGLATGRILLANFRGRWSMEDCDTMELWNGTRGAVNSLAWHPAVPGRLAGGLDRKQRDDGSVLVWDVSRPDWQWISAPDDTELWSNPIVASRSRGSMERLAALGTLDDLSLRQRGCCARALRAAVHSRLPLLLFALLGEVVWPRRSLLLQRRRRENRRRGVDGAHGDARLRARGRAPCAGGRGGGPTWALISCEGEDGGADPEKCAGLVLADSKRLHALAPRRRRGRVRDSDAARGSGDAGHWRVKIRFPRVHSTRRLCDVPGGIRERRGVTQGRGRQPPFGRTFASVSSSGSPRSENLRRA